MENSNKAVRFDTQLQITFPKSSEDHRLQLVGINGAIFAIVYSPLESLGPIRLYCEEWSLILLSPLKSKSNVIVSAKNVICLSEIVSEEGNVNVHASNRLVKFADLFKSAKTVSEMGERGESHFGEDLGSFLYYYRVFEQIVTGIHAGRSEEVSQARQQFIAALCALAGKIEDKTGSMSLSEVLTLWNIPLLKG